MSISVNSTAAPAALRSNSLAMCFQDVITVVLRVRHRVRPVSDANAFRNTIGQMIAAAGQESRSIGYSDASSKMALYAIVGFLDESVLTSQDTAFQDWSRYPLQVELFGGAFCGEYFFRHVNDLLFQQESSENADVLELHALCLLLGYRGKYAFGDSGEIASILRHIQDKIARTRGNLVLCCVRDEQPVIAAPVSDPWIRRLVLTTAAVILLTLLAFGAFWLLLANNLNAKQARSGTPARNLEITLRGAAL